MPTERIRIAMNYYGEYPEEIDRFIAFNEREAADLKRALENER